MPIRFCRGQQTPEIRQASVCRDHSDENIARCQNSSPAEGPAAYAPGAENATFLPGFPGGEFKFSTPPEPTDLGPPSHHPKGLTKGGNCGEEY